MESSDHENDLDDLNPFEEEPQSHLVDPAAQDRKTEIVKATNESTLPKLVSQIGNTQQVLDLMHKFVPKDLRKLDVTVTEMHLATSEILRNHPNMGTADLVEFWYLSMTTGASPLKKEIYLTPFRVKEKQGNQEFWRSKAATVFSYHFLNKIAELTGQLDSIQEDCQYVKELNEQGEEVVRLKAEAKIFRKGSSNPTIAQAYYDECVQTFFDKKTSTQKPNKQWQTQPKAMTKKCAIMRAMRLAFPNSVGGLYSEEEVGAIFRSWEHDMEEAQKSHKAMAKVNEHYARLGEKKNEEDQGGEEKTEEGKKGSGEKASKKRSSGRGAESANP